MPDSETQQRTWQEIKEIIDPLDQISRSAARNQEMDLLNQAICADDKRKLLADVRRKERSRIVKDKDTGLLRYEEDGADDMGDIHVGPKIEVRQVERQESQPHVPTAQPLPVNGTSKIGKALMWGALLVGGGAATTLGVQAITKALSQPPAAKAPADPPKYDFSIE